MIRKTPVMAAIAVMSLFAQQRGAPAAPQLLFNMTLQNQTRLPLTQSSVTTSNVDLQLYGDGRNIIVATGTGANFPRLFFGLCKGPCGFTLRDRNNYFDLRGRANLQFTTIVSGFHRVRPIIKLADGTLLIGDQAEGSVARRNVFPSSKRRGGCAAEREPERAKPQEKRRRGGHSWTDHPGAVLEASP